MVAAMTTRPRELARLITEASGALAVVVLLAADFAAAPAAAQETASPTVRGINGSWERYPSRFSGLGSDEEGAEPPPAPEPIPDPPLKPDYLEPWQTEQARIAELTRQGRPPATNFSACIGEGMPGMMQAIFPMEVLETPGQVTIIQEAYNQVRRVILGGELPAPEDAEPRFAGHSVGHWEGDTLVVETVGIKDYVLFRNVPHSNQMRIGERIRLVNHEYMEDVVTVTDPEYLTGPWTWKWMYRRWPGYHLQEYVCEDNKYFEDPETGQQRLRID
jgi:hypothetical protein